VPRAREQAQHECFLPRDAAFRGERIDARKLLGRERCLTRSDE